MNVCVHRICTHCFTLNDGGFGGGSPTLLGPELPVAVLINLGGSPVSPLDFEGGAAATGLVWFRDIRIPLASISIYFLKTELPLRKFKNLFIHKKANFSVFIE